MASRGPGGKREGAGRKPGSAHVKTREVANRLMAEEGATPLEIMFKAMRHFADMEPPDLEKAASIAAKAAPYVHATLKAVEITGHDGGPVQIVFTSADASVL